jgi:Dolichyl-phosphate-mannose-protein mannosyltransferase
MMPSRSNEVWQRAADYPLATIFLLALFIRLINLALLTGRDAFFAEQDTFAYWALGAALAKPDGFWPTLSAMTDRMPLYPLLLAGVQYAIGDGPRAIVFIQAVIDAATCTFVASLGALISARVGLIAGILAAFSPTLIVFSTQILTDTIFLFFFTLMLLAGAHFLLRPLIGRAIWAGLAGGFALATRPAVAALLAAAVPVVFAIAWMQRRRLGLALAAAMVFDVATAAPVAPVLLRNAIRYDSLSLTSQTGDYWALWIVPLVVQRANGTPYQVTADRMESRYRERIERNSLAANNPFWRAALKSELAREEMARLPVSAYAKAWLEGMIVNPCCAGSARRPTRARAAQAELLQHSWNEPVGTGANLPIRQSRTIPIAARPRPSRHAALPRARGDRICHVGAEHALGGAFCGRRARLFPRAQRAGGVAEIPFAAGARAARARGRTAGAPGGAAQTYLIRSRMLT